MEFNCKECGKTIYESQIRINTASAYNSETKVLQVSISKVARCIYCGTEQRVLPRQTSARAKANAS